MPSLVSVVIPCHNAAPWLAATLASVRAQTWPTIETIIVDDGSTDDSLAIARLHGQRAVILTQANAGAAAARNRGLRAATGEYIQFLDADDLLAPDKIECQLRQLEKRAESARVVAAGPWGRFEDDPSTARFVPEENWRDASPVEWLTLNFAGRGMMPPAAWLTPRAVIDAAGPWDERLTLNDDGEYFCRVLLASAGVRFCPEARSFYRSNLAGSLSRRRSESAWKSALLSQECCIRHLLAAEDSPRTRRAAADLMQRLAHAAWPDSPSVAARAQRLAQAHGGSPLRPGGGPLFCGLSMIFGWRFARRIQELRRSRSSR